MTTFVFSLLWLGISKSHWHAIFRILLHMALVISLGIFVSNAPYIFVPNAINNQKLCRIKYFPIHQPLNSTRKSPAVLYVVVAAYEIHRIFQCNDFLLSWKLVLQRRNEIKSTESKNGEQRTSQISKYLLWNFQSLWPTLNVHLL